MSVERLDGEVRKVVQASEPGKRIAAAVSGDATATSPDAFRGLLEREVTGGSRLAREMRIRAE